MEVRRKSLRIMVLDKLDNICYTSNVAEGKVARLLDILLELCYTIIYRTLTIEEW
jgi:hypothetical protein